MEFSLPKLGKDAIPFPHFPTKHQAFIFRAYEYIPPEKIAKLLGTTADNVRQAAHDMGLPEYDPKNIWLSKGYITIIRRMWHILPYSQLLELLEMDENTLAVILREEDFLDIKLKDKPVCEPVKWRELTDKEKAHTAEIKKIMEGVELGGSVPFEFKYDIPEIKLSGKANFDTRIIYAFSGLYLNAFEVDSETYCPDEMLEAYSRLGVNAVWAQAVLFQLTEFPFEPGISNGWEQRIERMRKFTERLERFGIKLILYINEPRCMPEEFYDKYPQLRGHKVSDDKIALCTSTKEVQDYLTNGIEAVCRAVPKLGGFFTITRSENTTNCYSHSNKDTNPCTCERCKNRPIADVVSEVIGCIAKGAHRVSPDIKVMAWSWAWNDENLNIIRNLPKDVILMSQSELAMPFEIGGVKGAVRDYSMSIVGPGERAKEEWRVAKERGLDCAAKVQINTTWEASTAPAIPVYDNIEKHMQGLKEEGVRHVLLSWTLGGYPSLNIMHAAKYFYESCETPKESDSMKAAVKLLSEAFAEYPFHIQTVYYGPHNAGPSTLLFEEPTGYTATMTCYAYDDVDKWRSIYPTDVFESQFDKLCSKWEKGLEMMENEPENETKIMAHATYCLFKASLNQIRFYRARDTGDKATMLEMAKAELEITEKMLSLMNKSSAIGFEAANHYYFSKGQLAEKIVNCRYIINNLK